MEQVLEVTTSAKTIADNDLGKVVSACADTTITLPTAAAGKVVTIRVGGAPVTAGGAKGATNPVGVKVTGSVTGLGKAGALSLDKAKAVVGDEVTLVSGAATWYPVNVKGAWAVA